MLNAAHALPYCATRLVTRGWTRATHSLRPVREFGAHNLSSRYTRLGASMRYKAGFINAPAKTTSVAAGQKLAKDPAPISAEAVQELVKPVTGDFGIPPPPEEPGSEGSPFIFLVTALLMKMHVQSVVCLVAPSACETCGQRHLPSGRYARHVSLMFHVLC